MPDAGEVAGATQLNAAVPYGTGKQFFARPSRVFCILDVSS